MVLIVKFFFIFRESLMVFSAMGKDFPWSNRPASHLGNLQLTLACLQCARRPVSPCTVTQWRWWTSSMVWKKYDGMCRSSVGHTEWPYYEVCRLIYGSSILANPPGASPVAPSMSSLSLTVLSNPADEVEIDAMTEWERGKEKKKKIPQQRSNFSVALFQVAQAQELWTWCCL